MEISCVSNTSVLVIIELLIKNTLPTSVYLHYFQRPSVVTETSWHQVSPEQMIISQTIKFSHIFTIPKPHYRIQKARHMILI